MKVHAKPLERKRRDLQMRCALQRQQVAYLGTNIEAKLATADRVLNVASTIAKSPILILAAIAGVVIVGPWRVMRWASQAALLFSAAKKVQQLIAK